MVSRGFNELKAVILGFLKRGESVSSDLLCHSIDAKRTNTCDCLGRLHKQRLVDRQQIPREKPGRPRYRYTLSKRGQDRLEFWQSKKRAK